MKKYSILALVLLTCVNTTWSGGGPIGVQRSRGTEKKEYRLLPKMVIASKISDRNIRESRGRSNRMSRSLCDCFTGLTGTAVVCAVAQYLLSQSVQLTQVYYNQTA